MTEATKTRKVFSLHEVMTSVQRLINQRYSSSFWVRAEMNKLNYYAYSGHCYPDLIEKKGDKVVAQMRSILWQFDFKKINDHFLEVLHEPLKDGISILFCARITFDPIYGLGLRILDIDPTYTLGELEKEKQETLSRLEQENLLHKNKEITFPYPFPHRIAVISVETSKGYADFQSVLENNSRGYRFFHMLFPSVLQGERAIGSIIQQLARIRKVQHHFDIVAIVRGGGGDVGLSCYNSYPLAAEIAQFPLPIFTGIGHATNQTVVEMISYKNAITPTELADSIIKYAVSFEDTIYLLQQRLSSYLQTTTQEYKKQLFETGRHIILAAQSILQNETHILDKVQGTLSQQADFVLKTTDKDLEHLTQMLDLVNPEKILDRGYSITTHEGSLLSKTNIPEEGSKIRTITSKFEIISSVSNINLKPKK